MMSSYPPADGHTEEDLDRVLKALGDTTRRRLLSRLSEGPAMVTELAKPFEMSLPAVGKHLRVLEKAGLITRSVSGRVHSCALNASPLLGVVDWLSTYERFWGATLDALNEHVKVTSPE